jgi:hypothetical protein
MSRFARSGGRVSAMTETQVIGERKSLIVNVLRMNFGRNWPKHVSNTM